MDAQQQQSTYAGWAILEIFGHQKLAGYVTTEYFGSTALLRVEVPPLPERERVTKHYEYIGDRGVPTGSRVRMDAVPGFSRLFGMGSIFSLTPCDEAFATKTAEAICEKRPLTLLALPPAGELVAGELPDFSHPDDDDEPADGHDID